MAPVFPKARPWKRHPEYESRLAFIEAAIAAQRSHRDIARDLGVARQRVTQLVAMLRERARPSA